MWQHPVEHQRTSCEVLDNSIRASQESRIVTPATANWWASLRMIGYLNYLGAFPVLAINYQLCQFLQRWNLPSWREPLRPFWQGFYVEARNYLFSKAIVCQVVKHSTRLNKTTSRCSRCEMRPTSHISLRCVGDRNRSTSPMPYGRRNDIEKDQEGLDDA